MLAGKWAFITGCSRGIGRATLEYFASCGANVIANARALESIEELCGTLAKQHCVEVVPSIFDVAKPDEVGNAFRSLIKVTKQLDILVNNAGAFRGALLGMISMAEMKYLFEVNTFGSIQLMQLSARLMQRQGRGSIINLSSIMGTRGCEGQVAYSASKAALIGATRSAAKELGPAGIRVNAVAPGFIETDMTQDVSAEIRAERIASIKMQRAGTATEVAQCIAFLGSDLSSYVTGQVLGVDGGMIL